MRSTDRDGKLATILNAIRIHGTMSRTDIAKRYRIDRKSVSLLIDALLRDGLIASAGLKDSDAGRKQELLRINGAHSNYVGVDLGSTHVTGVLLDLSAETLDRKRFEIRPDLPAEMILAQTRIVVDHLLSSTKNTAEVRGIGICVPGYVYARTGVSVRATSLASWSNIRVREIFESAFGLPVSVEEGTRAHAVYEKWMGLAKFCDNFVLVGAGYGIGAAIFLRQGLYEGSNNKAGELGHTVVKPDGAVCTCGNRGCLETIASGRAIEKRASEAVEAGESSTLRDLTHGEANQVTAKDVALAASMGDEFSRALLDEVGRFLGIALANLSQVLNPSRVIISGGLKNAGSFFVEAVRSALEDHLIAHIAEDLRIDVSQAGPDGGAQGAGIVAMQELFGFPLHPTCFVPGVV